MCQGILFHFEFHEADGDACSNVPRKNKFASESDVFSVTSS